MTTQISTVQRLKLQARRGVRAVAAARQRRRTAPSAMRELWSSGKRDVLVPEPVFLFSSVRSGSTLLRMMLDSHSAIVAPHEMHLSSLRLEAPTKLARGAMDLLELDVRELENMLWDAVLFRELNRAGKSIIVDKTPKNTFEWRRISQHWPAARYLFLLRHPVHINDSLIASRPDIPTKDHMARVTKYAKALNEAQVALRGLAVRYEELTAHPQEQTRRICDWLGVAWEPAMLDYARTERPIVRGLGDWSETIRAGQIRAPRPFPEPDDIPEGLRDACRILGYLD